MAHLGYEMGEQTHPEPGSPEDRRFRWWLYNFAFRIFGKTRCWKRLGQRLW